MIALAMANVMDGDQQSAKDALERATPLLTDAALWHPELRILEHAIMAHWYRVLAMEHLTAEHLDKAVGYSRQASAEYRAAVDQPVGEAFKVRAAGDLHDWEVMSAAVIGVTALQAGNLQLAESELYGAKSSAESSWTFLSVGAYDLDAQISEVILGMYVVTAEMYHIAARQHGHAGRLWLEVPDEQELSQQLTDLDSRARSIGRRGLPFVELIAYLRRRRDQFHEHVDDASRQPRE